MNSQLLALNCTDSVASTDLSHIARIRTFRPKTFFQMECGPYLIETVTSPEDLARVIDLRHHSFVEDFAPNANADWVDFDDYDLRADHVILKHVDTREILGSYRIICSEFSEKFYSEEQYNIGSVLAQPGVKIELGRACIHKDHRNGVTLSLIWKGLARYASLVRAQYMFGCASVKTVSPEIAYSMFWHLYPAFYNEEFRSEVLPHFNCPMPVNLDTLPPWSEIESQVPSLLKSYLQAGAWIASEPALDTFFNCVDFLTVLDLRQVNSRYSKRYF
jgi:putative hemolysin